MRDITLILSLNDYMALTGVVVPAKKLVKKPAKQALKSTLAMLTPSVAPPAGSTCSTSNARACLHTTNVAPEASAANKYKKPSACYGPGVISVAVTKGEHPKGGGLYGTSGTMGRGVSRVT